jgi:SAM-dependent methyltransferase
VGVGELVCSQCLSHYSISDGIPHLLADGLVRDWVIAEQSWWDKRYAQVRRDIDTIRPRRGLAGPRYYERATCLFAPLKQRGVRTTALLEVGAGTAQYVAHLLPPGAGQYFYIGTDIAREALLLGAQLIPEGDFVQCEAGRMPFRKESFDTLLCFGVLHHLPCWQSSLEQMIELLKPGAWLLFNEAIEKPRIFGGFLKKSLGTAIDSPHGGEIQFEALMSVLQRNGSVIMCGKKTTVLRVLLTWLLGWSLERSAFLTKCVLWLDKLFLRSIGRVIRRLGPAEALGIFEKRNRP